MTIEEQIYRERKDVDFDTRELTTEYIVDKYLNKIDEGKNEIYVPDYQREFVWDQERQSKFIESVILGLPIPYVFVSETKDGKFEIVDGSQRIRTLAAFLKNKLTLSDLKKLHLLNGKKFEDLESARQRKVNNTPIRMVVLTENTSEDVKTEMFERINRGSDLLKEMEQRRALISGKFTDFLYTITQYPKFISGTPQNKWLEKRQERQELALRFFALSENYLNYPRRMGIAKYLDEYMKTENEKFSESREKEFTDRFHSVVDFVDKSFRYKFALSHNPQVSRVYFEAVSVGSFLALKEKPNLSTSINKTETWLRTPELKKILSGKYETHSPERIKERIEYVKNKLLEQ